MSDDFHGDDFEEEQAAEASAARQKQAEDDERALAKLRRRQGAYRRVFASNAGIADDVKVVLDDIFNFCKFGDTPFHPDSRIHCLLTGRYEVARRIEDHRTLTFDELVTKYTQEPK